MEFKVGDWVKAKDSEYQGVYKITWVAKDGDCPVVDVAALCVYVGQISFGTFDRCELEPTTPTEAELAEWDAALAACGLARLERVK